MGASFFWNKENEMSKGGFNYGNPPTLNFNHWNVKGVHNKPVRQHRVLAGSLVIFGVACVVFQGFRIGRDTPSTVSSEWRKEQKKRYRERQMDPISTHKIGATPKVFEPSIVEES